MPAREVNPLSESLDEIERLFSRDEKEWTFDHSRHIVGKSGLRAVRALRRVLAEMNNWPVCDRNCYRYIREAIDQEDA